jgi:hypothetical protein
MPEWLTIDNQFETPRRVSYRAEDIRRVVLIDHADEKTWGVGLAHRDMPNQYVWVFRTKASEEHRPLLKQTFDSTLKALRAKAPVAELRISCERTQGGLQVAVEFLSVEDVSKPEPKKPAPRKGTVTHDGMGRPQPKNQIRDPNEQKEEEARKGRLRSAGLLSDLAPEPYDEDDD